VAERVDRISDLLVEPEASRVSELKKEKEGKRGHSGCAMRCLVELGATDVSENSGIKRQAMIEKGRRIQEGWKAAF